MNEGMRIKARREELGMTQDELAKKLGYKSRSSINKIELGERKLTQSKFVANKKPPPGRSRMRARERKTGKLI